MTNAEIETLLTEIEGREQKATPGPLRVREKLSGSENHKGFTIYSPKGYFVADVSPMNDENGDPTDGGHNAEFFANARTDIPALVKLVRELMQPKWIDCSTAPKDGTHFLAGIFGESSIGFGYFGGKCVKWQGVIHYWSHPGEEGFYPSTGTGTDYPVKFSHWQPLPESPQSGVPQEDKQ